MATVITDTLKGTINCCSIDKADEMVVKGYQGLDSQCYNLDTILLLANARILDGYIYNGTVLVPGFTADVTIDMSTATVGINIIGQVVIAGFSYPFIGLIPEATYPTVLSLVAAIVQGINDLTPITGFTAVDNLDETFTISAPVGSGTTLNGAVVSIILNPLFEWYFTHIHDSPIKPWRGEAVIDTDSSLHNTLIIPIEDAASGTSQILTFYDRTLVNTTNASDVGIFTASKFSPGVLVFNELSNTVGAENLVGPYGNHSFNDLLTAQQNPFMSNTAQSIFGPLTYGDYNPVNNWTYFQQGVDILMVDSLNAFIDKHTLGFTGATGVLCDPVTGRIWSGQLGGIEVFTPANPIAVFATIVIAAKSISDFTYYPGTTPGTERVFAVNKTDGTILKYNVDGTPDGGVFFTSVSGQKSIIEYSPTYNVIFLSGNAAIDVVRLDGTLRQTYDPYGTATAGVVVTDVRIDGANGTIVVWDNVSRTDVISWSKLGSAGTENFAATLITGIPDVIQSEGDQCVSEGDMNGLSQELTAECDCDDCGDGTASLPIVTGVTYAIYFGNSANAALASAGVEALGSINKDTYAGTYIYIAAASEYKYFAYPTSLGTPSRFVDTATMLDVVMDAPYTVIITGTTYTVYRSFNLLGGAITMEVQV